ncbi:hypothetical protein G9C85_00140 [Halorubellus sp. JP-L1]|uniref:hypothetical protein n=1 Tax=Halorubellus sp. JP-L1 TaxID=2715753 RepID=UPI0014079F7A|nr:hypothetical protein [Halorubellus sp. JP-L1]NHN40047.1 hypothetical protein [Halorubellus sp. JP-L1]
MSTHDTNTTTTDTNGSAEWSPPDDYDWGEGTRQGRRILEDEDVDDAPEWWTDAYEMRMRFGIPAFDPDAHDHEVYPDTLIHEKPADEWTSSGGTNWLKVGEKGCGKSTDNLNWGIRLMDENDETVVWAASPHRSEWLPVRDYVTLWLPANASVDASWVYDATGREPEDVDDIADLVRDVRYYDDVLECAEAIQRHPNGTFNVVYPDPSFSGCEELTAASSRTGETLPFTPEWHAMGDEGGTPLTHWWVAYWLARVDEVTNRDWTSVIYDEFHHLFRSDTEQDAHRSYRKMVVWCEAFDDSRRARASWFGVIHRENKAHWMPREEFDVRIDMPDGTPNPRSGQARSIPQGFSTVPMYADIMSDRKVGRAIMYDQSEFSPYAWTDVKAGTESEDRKLVLELGEPDDADDDRGDDAEDGLQYDRGVWNRWQRNDKDRLYVSDPGDGYIDLTNGEVVERLESPSEALAFDGTEVVDGERVVWMEDLGRSERVVVARIPIPSIGLEGTPGLEDDDVDDDRGDDVDDADNTDRPAIVAADNSDRAELEDDRDDAETTLGSERPHGEGLDEDDLDVDDVESAAEVIRRG